jgi:hypothetical protein
MHGGRNSPCQRPVSAFVSPIGIAEREKNGR